MKYRILPPEEYNRLVGRGWFTPGNLPGGDTSVVAVAETEGGELVGYWMAQAIVHLEPLWVAEEQRKSGLTAASLLKTAVEELLARDVHYVVMTADNAQSAEMISGLGFKEIKNLAWFEGVI